MSDVEVEDADPEDFRALIYGAATSERVRWFKAMLDPLNYDAKSATVNTESDGRKWLRVEQDSKHYRALFGGLKVVKKYTAQGEALSSDIGVTTMPDELPIGDHDWIIPIGRSDYGTVAPDARTFTYKDDMLVRGSIELPQVGTVAANGVNITGTGTAFLSTYAPGDIIKSAKTPVRVRSVQDNTHLIVETAPNPVWNGNKHERCVERLRWDTVVSVDDLTDGVTFYRYEKDFTLDKDGQTLRWLSFAHSPIVGARLSAAYRYLPKYVVLGDCGTKRHVVNGVGLPQTVIARLWNPEQQRTP